jgi:D-alanine-D-alanine ligase
MRQGIAAQMIDIADPGFVESVRRVDVAFLAIAGQFAEDGKLQGVLETLGVPYTGSGVLASALAMNKPAAKVMVAAHGVPVLPSVPVDGCRSAASVAAELVEAVGLPLMLKPESEGGSIDLAVAHDVSELAGFLTASRQRQRMLAERFCAGRPVTVGVLEGRAGLQVLPALETQVKGREFYDYHAKRDAGLRAYRCPADLPAAVTDNLTEYARTAHAALGCTGVSRSDFVVSAGGSAFWLELNTLPGLAADGNLTTAAAAAGICYEHLIATILNTAMVPRGYRS